MTIRMSVYPAQVFQQWKHEWKATKKKRTKNQSVENTSPLTRLARYNLPYLDEFFDSFTWRPKEPPTAILELSIDVDDVENMYYTGRVPQQLQDLMLVKKLDPLETYFVNTNVNIGEHIAGYVRDGQFELVVEPERPLYASLDPQILLDTLSLAASLSTIAQLFLMVEDMWSRKHYRSSSSPDKKKSYKTKKEEGKLRRIRVLMSDGTYVEDDWENEPERLKQFLALFQKPGVKPKPLRVNFYPHYGQSITLYLDEHADSSKWLDDFIAYFELKKPKTPPGSKETP